MSNYEWKPGTVAVATVRGVPNVRVTPRDGLWYSLTPVEERSIHTPDRDVTDVRPLVVLDPEDMQQVKSLIRVLRRVDMLDPSWDEDGTRAGVTKALRSLVVPPKPAEPLNVGSIVTDNDGELWARHGNGMWSCLQSPPGNDFATWDDLVDKYGPVSEGVTA